MYRGGRAVPLRFIFFDYCYCYWDTQRELVGRREACGRRQLFLFSYLGCFLTLWLWCELLFLPLSLPPLLFFGSRSIFRAAKTENPASSSTGSPSSKYHRRPTQSVCVADCYFIVNVVDLPFASPIAIYRKLCI